MVSEVKFRPAMDPHANDMELDGEKMGSLQWHPERAARVVLITGDSPLLSLEVSVLRQIVDKYDEIQQPGAN